MSYQAVLLPKWSLHARIVLAKGQLDNSYTFWTMANCTTGSTTNFYETDFSISSESVAYIFLIFGWFFFLIFQIFKYPMVPFLKFSNISSMNTKTYLFQMLYLSFYYNNAIAWFEFVFIKRSGSGGQMNKDINMHFCMAFIKDATKLNWH